MSAKTQQQFASIHIPLSSPSTTSQNTGGPIRHISKAHQTSHPFFSQIRGVLEDHMRVINQHSSVFNEQSEDLENTSKELASLKIRHEKLQKEHDELQAAVSAQGNVIERLLIKLCNQCFKPNGDRKDRLCFECRREEYLYRRGMLLAETPDVWFQTYELNKDMMMKFKIEPYIDESSKGKYFEYCNKVTIKTE